MEWAKLGRLRRLDAKVGSMNGTEWTWEFIHESSSDIRIIKKVIFVKLELDFKSSEIL